jgi:hypothetical protein
MATDANVHFAQRDIHPPLLSLWIDIDEERAIGKSGLNF